MAKRGSSDASGARVQQSLVEHSDRSIPVQQSTQQHCHMEDLVRVTKIVKNAFIVFLWPPECVNDSTTNVRGTSSLEVQANAPNIVHKFAIDEKENVVKSWDAR